MKTKLFLVFATEKGHNLSRGVPSECKNNWECPTTLISADEAPKGMQLEQSNSVLLKRERKTEYNHSTIFVFLAPN